MMPADARMPQLFVIMTACSDDIYPCDDVECCFSNYSSYSIIEYSADCNGDGIVDYGQILDGTFNDVDGNGIPDCCDDFSCIPEASACCIGGSCTLTSNEIICASQGGIYYDGQTCEDVTCPTTTVSNLPQRL